MSTAFAGDAKPTHEAAASSNPDRHPFSALTAIAPRSVGFPRSTLCKTQSHPRGGQTPRKEPPFSKRRLPFAFGSLFFAKGGSQKKKQAAEKKWQPPFSDWRLPIAFGSLLFFQGGSRSKTQPPFQDGSRMRRAAMSEANR